MSDNKCLLYTICAMKDNGKTMIKSLDTIAAMHPSVVINTKSRTRIPDVYRKYKIDRK